MKKILNTCLGWGKKHTFHFGMVVILVVVGFAMTGQQAMIFSLQDQIGKVPRMIEVSETNMKEWIDVCNKVLNSRKCLQIFCQPDEVEFLLSKLKHKGLFLSTHCDTEDEAYVLLKRVNV